MYYLIYVSQSKRPMTPDQLKGILASSRRNNQRDEITGLLIYKHLPVERRAYFIQMLEGDERRVRAAFDRISKDARHHTIIRLEAGEIATRAFPDWSMGFLDADARPLIGAEGVVDIGAPEFWDDVLARGPGAALALMESFGDDLLPS